MLRKYFLKAHDGLKGFVCRQTYLNVYRLRSAPSLVAIYLLCLHPTGAYAQSLSQALADAYRTNPELIAARARLRGTDENVAQARAGYRPTVSGTAEYGFDHTKTNPTSSSDGQADPHGVGITLSQPVFRGFRTFNAVKGAKAGVAAAREDLRDVEQTVLLSAVGAYMNVLRDQEIVRSRQNNVRVLNELLHGTKERKRLQQATVTDVAQTVARRAAAISLLQLAEANLQTSRSDFERIVGHLPHNLRTPPLPNEVLPKSLEDAVAIAESESPAVLAALHRQSNAQYITRELRGRLLPDLNIVANYQRRYDTTPQVDGTEDATVVGRLTVPLYQAGRVHSQIRQARQNETAAAQDVIQARLLARANTIAAWTRLAANRAQVQSDRIRVSSSETALDGVKREESVGQRDVLDILNAEQELLDALVQQASNKRERTFSAYALLRAIGRLTAPDLSLPAAVYDPEVHLSTVEHKPWGTTVTRYAK